MSALPVPLGIRHVALRVRDMAAMRAFYTDVLGYRVEWEPSVDECYLTLAGDNLALHQRKDAASTAPGDGALDHFGIVVKTPADVDAYHAHFLARGARCKTAPRTHRDGARSFYAADPEGNVIQVLYHPPISDR